MDSTVDSTFSVGSMNDGEPGLTTRTTFWLPSFQTLNLTHSNGRARVVRACVLLQRTDAERLLLPQR